MLVGREMVFLRTQRGEYAYHIYILIHMNDADDADDANCITCSVPKFPITTMAMEQNACTVAVEDN